MPKLYSRDVPMLQHDLAVWLDSARADGPTATEVALLFDADLHALSEGELHAARFVLAALRDMYADEVAVWRWLFHSHPVLEGARPAELVRDGRMSAVAALVTAEWNGERPLRAPKRWRAVAEERIVAYDSRPSRDLIPRGHP
jgi:hypothetical protein